MQLCTVQISDYQLGIIPPTWVFADIHTQFGLHQLVRKRSATGIKWVEAREAGKHTNEQCGSLETKT